MCTAANIQFAVENSILHNAYAFLSAKDVSV